MTHIPNLEGDIVMARGDRKGVSLHFLTIPYLKKVRRYHGLSLKEKCIIDGYLRWKLEEEAQAALDNKRWRRSEMYIPLEETAADVDAINELSAKRGLKARHG